MRTVLVTWNLKGSANPDVGAVTDHLRRQGADVVALQEVQWHQARRIARGLGARSCRWSLKHWPVRTWPEGMAVIGVTRDVRVRTRALSYRWRVWSWRRRIVQVATIDGGDGRGAAFTLVNAHLTPYGRDDLRAVETSALLAIVADRAPVVVAGDLNERPGGAVHGKLAAAGLRDSWVAPVAPAVGSAPGGPGAPEGAGAPSGRGRPDDAPSSGGHLPTNWRGWRRGTDAPPAQTLDYVYVPPEVSTVALSVPRAGDEGFARFATLSDHLPVTAVLDWAE